MKEQLQNVNIQKYRVDVGCHDPLIAHAAVEVVNQVTQIIRLWPAHRHMHIEDIHFTDRNCHSCTGIFMQYMAIYASECRLLALQHYSCRKLATSTPLLATWLDQRSVRHRGTAAYGPFPIVGGLPTPYRTPRLRHLSTLQWWWWDGRTSGVNCPARPGAAGVMAKSPLSNRSKMPMELPGEDQGGDPSPLPGMREKTRVFAFAYKQ